jgi:tetratricopeptide (TPR) repeat protein
MPESPSFGSFRRRFGGGPLLAAVLAASVCACADAGDSPALDRDAPPASPSQPPGQGREPEAAARGGAAAFALAYPASEDEVEVAAAQAALGRAPHDTSARAGLALAFLARLRATAEPRYAALARDALGESPSPALPPTGDSAEARWWLARGMLAMDAHDFARAADIGTALVARSADDYLGHLLRGDALLELGRYEEALDAHQAALDLRPGLRTFNRAAHLRWLFGDDAGALEMLDEALGASDGRDPEALAWCYADRARVHWHAGRTEDALRDADTALRWVDAYPPALSVRADALIDEGRAEEALSAFRRLAERQPDGDAWARLARLAARLGDTVASAEARARAEALAEHDPRVVAELLAAEGRDLERARALAEAAVAERPTIAAWATLAEVARAQGDAARAAEADAAARRWGTRYRPSP